MTSPSRQYAPETRGIPLSFLDCPDIKSDCRVFPDGHSVDLCFNKQLMEKYKCGFDCTELRLGDGYNCIKCPRGFP